MMNQYTPMEQNSYMRNKNVTEETIFYRKIYKVLQIGLYSPKYRYNMKIQEQSIGQAFLKEPWKKLTYNDVRKISGSKSKSYIYRALSHLMYDEVISTETVGKSLLYTLNLYSIRAQSYLGLLNEYISWYAGHMPHGRIESIASKIPTSFYVFIVTGSYAKKTHTTRSDLDITIICDDSVDPKSIMAEIKSESMLGIPQIHPFVFKRNEFIQMLLDKKENYGKEVARYNNIFYGGQMYYNILNEAIQRGFKG